LVKPATAGSPKITSDAPLGPLFVTRIVYVVVPPALTLATPSVLEIATSATGVTVSVSVAVLPMPPLVDEAATLFVNVPSLVAVAVTVTLQLVFTGRDVRLKITLGVGRFVAVSEKPPRQVVDWFGGATNCNPAGNISVKETLVKGTVLTAGFVIVNVIIDVPFKATGSAPKDLVMVGGATTMTTFVPSLLVSSISVTLPFGSTVAVLDKEPAAVGLTPNVALSDAPGGNITAAPLAIQVSVPLLIAQSIGPKIPPPIMIRP